MGNKPALAAALACCLAAQTALAQGDVFSSSGGRPAPGSGDVFSSGPGTGGSKRGSGPGGGPMYGNGAYGRDPECGGTDRSYYDRQYNSHGIVVSIEVMQQVYRRTGGAAWIRCGACGDRAICWPRPGYDSMIQDALAGGTGGQSGPNPAPESAPAYNAGSGRFELAATDNEPAVTSMAQADELAGQVIQDLRILYGDKTIDELSVPRSHASNAQSAVIDYLASKVTLAGVLARLTKGQVKAFIGKFGEAVMAKVFPNARLQMPMPGFPGRIADQLEGNIVREVKTGGFDITSKTLQCQIAIDAKMVKAGYRVEWWNVKSPFGRQQFSDDLVAYLQQHGIVPVSHIAP